MSTAKKENVLKAIVVSLFFPALYFVIMFLVNYGYSIIWKLSHVGMTKQQVEAQVSSVALILLMVIAVVFFLITFIIFQARHESLPKRIEWNPAPKKSVYGFAVLLGVGLIFTSVLVSLAIPKSWTANDTVANAATGQSLILAILAVGIIAPIAEETAFRGLMMTHLKSRFAPWLAVAIPALVFCAFHAYDSLGHMFTIIPLAVSLGLVFYWTRSIRVTIMIHILNNIIPLIMAVTANSTGSAAAGNTSSSTSASIVMGIIGLAIVMFALVMIYKRRQKSESILQTITN
ncbi:MAG: CPBP family intramembrane metalloprotease [Oscillospiraceae bacterium]|nr:CPBP family intramembrane metalloprotease [Oscillospiraceae bacterium]